MPYIKRWHKDNDGAIIGDLYNEKGLPQGFFVIPDAVIDTNEEGERIVYNPKNKERAYLLIGKEVPIEQIML